MATSEIEIARDVELTLHDYCAAIDTADFDALAALFTHGQWFAVATPGAAAVRQWLGDHVVLYEGRTCTRHEITNLRVRTTPAPDEAAFSCYVSISLDLPGQVPALLAHCTFDGLFRRRDGAWWWATHEVNVQHAGDLSTHIKGGIGALG